MRRMLITAAAGIAAALICRAEAAQAAPSCDLSGLQNIVLGSIEGTLLHPISKAASIQVTCSGLEADNPLGYCISVSNNPLDISSGMPRERVLWRYNVPFAGNSFMPFNFYKEDGSVWGGGGGLSGYGKPITGMTAGDSGTKTYNIPISITLDDKPGPTMSAGPHSNYFDVALSYSSNNVDSSNLENLCAPGSGAQFASPGYLQVQTIIKNSCNVTVTNNVNFGRSWSADAVRPAYGTVSANCSKGTAYQIGLSPGNYAGGDGRRAMKCQTSDTCKDNLIYYDLYKDGAYTQVWGDGWDSGNIVKGKSNGDSSVNTDYTVYAKLYPGQTADPGAYRDAIIVTIRIDNTPGGDD